MTDPLAIPATLDRRAQGQVPDNYDPQQGLKAVAVAEAA